MHEIVLVGQRSFGAAVFQRIHEMGLPIRAVVAPDVSPLEGPKDLLQQKARLEHRPIYDRVTPELVEGALVLCAHSHDYIGQRSRQAAWDVLGYHPSLLPRHRGRDAVKWTIRMGDIIAGGTVYRLTSQVDAGPIFSQSWCWVKPGWTASDLWREELFPRGVALLADAALGSVMAGKQTPYCRPQDEEMATWEPSLASAPLYKPELLELEVGRGATT